MLFKTILNYLTMAQFDISMPKLGESITEATIIKWLRKPGDVINEDDPLCEIATDKVDSEIPSPVAGKLMKVLYKEGDIVEVGKVIAIIATEGEDVVDVAQSEQAESKTESLISTPEVIKEEVSLVNDIAAVEVSISDRFYSPLVRSMAKAEQIPLSELDKLSGTGKEGRLTKHDLLNYIEKRTKQGVATEVSQSPKSQPVIAATGDTIVEMDRMRQLIATHMVHSKHTSAHVTSFSEADMSKVVKYREAHKEALLKSDGEKLTFTHIIMHVVAKALKEFPFVNASVDGTKVILRKNINLGMATALPNGNLIVPVIKNADEKSLLGIMKSVNDLAARARNNKLQPDDIQGGTFTITNLGTFNSTTGTPIINQPQVAILALGVIKKRAVVIESEFGDSIGIRPVMYLSLTYDHRVVDGALGGMFLDRVVKLLEAYEG